MVKAKEIEGFLVEKMPHGEYPTGRVLGHNNAITKQGEVDLSLDRESLAEIIWTIEKGDRAPKNEQPMILEQCYRYADVIIANLHKILVAKKDI